MLTALAGTALLGAGLFGAPGAAAAETAADTAVANTCDAGYYCVYWDANYQGRECPHPRKVPLLGHYCEGRPVRSVERR
ncbi:peptidase inhibitor family I36 protein, partial [Streptomyces sp. NPDC001478]